MMTRKKDSEMQRKMEIEREQGKCQDRRSRDATLTCDISPVTKQSASTPRKSDPPDPAQIAMLEIARPASPGGEATWTIGRAIIASALVYPAI